MVVSMIEKLNFGSIPIREIQSCSRNLQDSRFIHIGYEAYRLSVKSTGELVIMQIIFENVASQVVMTPDFPPPFELTLLQPNILAAYQVETAVPSENLLVCVTQDQIFHTAVNQNPKICVRRMHVSGTPRRIMYYRPLNLLLVACMIGSAHRREGSGSRNIIRFLDPLR